MKLNSTVMRIAARGINRQLGKAIDHAGVVRGPVKGLHGLPDGQLMKPSYQPEQARSLVYEVPRTPSKKHSMAPLTVLRPARYQSVNGSILGTAELTSPPLAIEVPFRELRPVSKWLSLEKPTSLGSPGLLVWKDVDLEVAPPTEAYDDRQMGFEFTEHPRLSFYRTVALPLWERMVH